MVERILVILRCPETIVAETLQPLFSDPQNDDAYDVTLPVYAPMWGLGSIGVKLRARFAGAVFLSAG